MNTFQIVVKGDIPFVDIELYQVKELVDNRHKFTLVLALDPPMLGVMVFMAAVEHIIYPLDDPQKHKLITIIRARIGNCGIMIAVFPKTHFNVISRFVISGGLVLGNRIKTRVSKDFPIFGPSVFIPTTRSGHTAFDMTQDELTLAYCKEINFINDLIAGEIVPNFHEFVQYPTPSQIDPMSIIHL